MYRQRRPRRPIGGRVDIEVNVTAIGRHFGCLVRLNHGARVRHGYVYVIVGPFATEVGVVGKAVIVIVIAVVVIIIALHIVVVQRRFLPAHLLIDRARLRPIPDDLTQIQKQIDELKHRNQTRPDPQSHTAADIAQQATERIFRGLLHMVHEQGRRHET